MTPVQIFVTSLAALIFFIKGMKTFFDWHHFKRIDEMSPEERFFVLTMSKDKARETPERDH